MATNYGISAYHIGGEIFRDTVSTNIRAEVFHIAQIMGFGEHVVTRIDKKDPEFKHYYFHNGRITVWTQTNQYTHEQRMGRSRREK